ncbi:uncharacterized protein AtWU_06534 [Aspergillus tubingensis]|uniref:uncharacterized protein n=1 Tax=Aspergillus tubingensis TaxID=5068 RepID=UPI00157A02B3|nr:uncharacterized protein AtWU_06534 [Aspergillus tubingensis]GFN16732.1 hypothetical protein AtWU_06534 [Aspergillus tubingensis]
MRSLILQQSHNSNYTGRRIESVTWDPNLRVIQLAASYEPPGCITRHSQCVCWVMEYVRQTKQAQIKQSPDSQDAVASSVNQQIEVT